MIFKIWEKRVSKKRGIPGSRKNWSSLPGVNPKLKQKAYDRAMVIRKYHSLLLSKGFKKKTEMKKEFLADFNSGSGFWSDGSKGSISKICSSTLHNWEMIYKKNGLAGLVPRYKTKSSTGRAVFRHPCSKKFEMKFSGQPRRNGRARFLERIKRHWKSPPLECPIRLTIFYSMKVPRGIRMARRMKILKHRISHTIRPNLDALNAFAINCMTGIVFKNHSQILSFHSEKEYCWWPQTKIIIQPLKG